MRKFLSVFMMAMILSLSIFQTVSFCQEEEKDAYAGGFVSSTTANSITVKEIAYDQDTDEQITEEVTYIVTPDTEIENVASVQEIIPGTQVDVGFTEKNGKKTATYVYVETPDDI